MRLSRAQRDVVNVLAHYLREHHVVALPADSEIRDGCFVGGFNGESIDGIQQHITIWRLFTLHAPRTRCGVARACEALVRKGFAARVFSPDNPGHEPQYVLTQAGYAYAKRRTNRK